MEKKTNKAKLDIFIFLKISALSQDLQCYQKAKEPLITLEVIMPYLQILQKYAY